MSGLRRKLVRWHRWIALALSPAVLLLLLSGAVLAFRPMFETPAPEPPKIDLVRVIALLRAVDPNDRAPAIAIDPAGPGLLVESDTAPPTVYRLSDGVQVPLEMPVTSRGIFDIARRVHHDLWFGLGGLVTLASFGLLALTLIGPWLAPLRRPRSLLTWHAAAGWVLWPLAVLLPLTAVLIVLPIGRPFGGARNGPAVPLPVALEQAAALADLSDLRFVQRMPNGGLFLITHEPGGECAADDPGREGLPLRRRPRAAGASGAHGGVGRDLGRGDRLRRGGVAAGDAADRGALVVAPAAFSLNAPACRRPWRRA